MRVHDGSGAALDAEVGFRRDDERGAGHVMMFESRSGRIGDPKTSRNPDYKPALIVALGRLKRMGARLVDAQVTSTRTEGLTEDERRLWIQSRSYPVDLRTVGDVEALASDLMRRHRAAGKAGAGPGTPSTEGAYKRADYAFLAPGLEHADPDIVARAVCGWDFPSDTEAEEHDGLIAYPPEVPLDREVSGKARVEQPALRARLVGKAKIRDCALCGRSLPTGMLWAAHIKPRSKCEHSERLDIDHVAMLVCLLGCDAAYERGLLGVDGAGVIHVSARCEETPDLAEALRGLQGRLCSAFSPRSARYFNWHWRSRFGANAID